MSNPSAESTARTQLRQIITTIEQQLEGLSRQPASEGTEKSVAELRMSWSKLVQLLALGSEPEVRECPTCKHVAMRAASLCGYCWTKLEPLVDPGTPDAPIRVE